MTRMRDGKVIAAVHSDRVLDSREFEVHKRQNPLLDEHCAFLEVIHLFR